MTALLAEFEGKFDLIYADPPFRSGKAYRVRTGHGEDSRRPRGWRTELGFSDTWGGLPDYLNMLFPRLRLMHRLLSDQGTLYLHLDWHSAAYGRMLLDEIFGPDRMLNEIIWLYHGPSPIRSAFKRKHDTIYAYTKSAKYRFNADAVRVPYHPATHAAFASSPRAGFGKQPNLKRGKVPEDWWYFPVVARLHTERTGYPTQKPEGLLERIVAASSRRGGLVGDFFCGAGTTPVVADRLGRRWIACDVSPLAVTTTHRRLLLQPAAQAYSTWSEPVPPRHPRPQLKLQIQIKGRAAECRLIGPRQRTDGGIQGLELDWEFDGKLFRSRSQVFRKWRAERFRPILAHRYRRPGRYRLAARVMTARGTHLLPAEEIEIA